METRRNTQRERRKDLKSKSSQWLICCEGRSEAIYLTDLIDELSRKSGKESTGIFIGLNGKYCSRNGFQGACGRQHCELLNRADTCRSSAFFEKVWIVFDQDADGKPNADELHKNFRTAIQRGKDTDIEVIWSIPCFEYWLVSHINYYDTFSTNIFNCLRSKFEASAEAGLRCNRRYQNQAGESHCSKPNPVICSKAFDKPYYNSFTSLGNISGVKTACKNTARCYSKNKDLINKGKFKAISCSSNMHILIEALCNYFGFSSIDEIKL